MATPARIDLVLADGVPTLRNAIREGAESGTGIAADDVFTELEARYADLVERSV